nr:MAG TPA: hypothetical protein [Caudoviricetes sp.]
MYFLLRHIHQQCYLLWVIVFSFVQCGMHCLVVWRTGYGIAGLYKPCSHLAKQLTNIFFNQMII